MGIDGSVAESLPAGTADSITVLHVDDDADFVEMAATFLERASDRLSVLTETDPTTVIDRIDAADVDCVVSDYDMPERTGLDLLRAVREDHPDLPFVLFTGAGDERVASEAVSAGVTDYLRKGGSTDQYAALATRIENAVDRRTVERLAGRAFEALDTAREGIALFDEDGRVRYANPAYADIVGYDRETLVGDHWATLCADDHAERVREEILPAVRETGRWVGRTAYERPDGERVSTSHAVVAAADGTVVCLMQELDATADRLDEPLLGDALDAIDDPFCVLDGDGTVLHANEALAAATGESVEALHSTPVTDLFAPDERPRVRECLRTARDAGADERDLELATPDGTRVYEFDVRALPGDAGDMLVAIGRDVSDRVDRERALTDLHRATRDLMRADSRSAVAAATTEALADVLSLTHAAVHLHDERESSLVPVAWTDRVETVIGDPPALGPDSLAWESFEAGKSRRYDDYDRTEGLHNEATPLRSELIVPLGDHGVALVASTDAAAFDDVDRRLAEILCRNAAAALDRVDRERALHRREAELERENDRLDRFAGIVSHDLRNPLEVANARIELAGDEYDSEHLEAADRALDRMAAIIDDALTLAREGRDVDERTPVSLRSVVEDCWANVDTGDADLRVDTERTVLADEDRLTRVFENLVRNAVTHAGPDVTITVGDLDDGVYVADDGPGIPDDEREQVFETGYSTAEDGTGFGLSIVRDIVEAHGWDIALTEGADGGARFEITGVDAA